MKQFLLVLFSIFSLPAFAVSTSFSLEGQVVRVEPRVRYSTTYERECWTEEVPVQSSSNRSYGGATIGGLTGGIVGNQVGKGNGKTAATAVGAVIGALVGDNIDNDGYREPSVQYRSEQRCRSVPRNREIPDGYDVTVSFQGQNTAMFRMPENPGYGTIRLNFNGTVTPVRW